MTSARGNPLLRPEFVSVGTDFFIQSRRDDLRENSEWASFNYVSAPLSGGNPLYDDNKLNDDIRYSGKMYKPKYKSPPKLPSKEAVRKSELPMNNVNQIRQPWQNVFDGAKPKNLKPIEINSPFDRDLVSFLSTPFNTI